MNKTALITGASCGLGKKFAELFAKRGYALVLTARSKGKLYTIAHMLKEQYGVPVEVYPADLTKREDVRQLCDFTVSKKIQIDVLINNAGFGDWGAFATADAQKQYQMIQCNIAALTALTHFYLQEMLQRNKGWILNVSSVAAFEPGPLMSVYYATKAFVLSFTEALSVELEGTGVHISALCPGPTRTGFARAAHLGRSGLFSNLPVADATDVAHYGVSQLFAGKVIAVPGWSNKLAIQVVKFLPRSLTRHLVYWIQK